MILPSKRTVATVLGYVGLTFALTTSAAQGLDGTDTVDSGDIVNGTIVGSDIKKNSVAGKKLKDDSVASVKITDGTIVQADLDPGLYAALVGGSGSGVADGSVTEAKLADGAVTSGKIADGTIVQADLDSGLYAALASVTLTDGSVGTAKLADDAVTGAKVAANTLTGDDIDESTLVLDSGWHTLTMYNTNQGDCTWATSAYGNGYQAPRYLRDADGIVHLEGNVNNTTTTTGSPCMSALVKIDGTPHFTGYEVFPAVCSQCTGGIGRIRVVPQTDWVYVVVENLHGEPLPSGTTTHVSLSGVSFPMDPN